MKSGVYIHIPFCEQRCFYCAFTVAVTSEDTFAPYVDRLVREIELSGFSDEPSTVYFGGGTPSIIGAHLLERLIRCFRGIPSEVSIEVNPGTLSREKIDRYREMGITRVSLGAQSLQDEDLQRAGRLHNAATVLADFELLRRSGFANINLDLIAGLPNQRLDTWNRNLDGVLSLQPEHISLYMLDVEERSTWGKATPVLPEDEDFADFYSTAEARLSAAGYEHYEISNWALPGYECRHNLGYWTGVPYRGFGVSAHSYDGTRRFWNTSSMGEYSALLDAGRLPTTGEEILTRELRIEEAFMLGLRQSAGLDIHRTAAAFSIKYPQEWFSRVRDLQEANRIDFDGRVLKLTSAGRLVANSVIEELIWPNRSSIFEATP